MELIQILDENGNFTGQIMDKDEAHNKNLLHNEVCVFIINDNHQTLLQKRSPNKRYGANKWALCAGHVDAYESLETAALRELREEIGIELGKHDLKLLAEKQLSIKSSNSNVKYYYYIKSNLRETDFIIQEEELSEVKWFDIDEVINMILRHDNTIVFKDYHLKFFKQLKELY